MAQAFIMTATGTPTVTDGSTWYQLSDATANNTSSPANVAFGGGQIHGALSFGSFSISGDMPPSNAIVVGVGVEVTAWNTTGGSVQDYVNTGTAGAYSLNSTFNWTLTELPIASSTWSQTVGTVRVYGGPWCLPSGMVGCTASNLTASSTMQCDYGVQLVTGSTYADICYFVVKIYWDWSSAIRVFLT